MASGGPALCRNGPGCSYLARGRCIFSHPKMEDTVKITKMEDTVNITKMEDTAKNTKMEDTAKNTKIEDTAKNMFAFSCMDSLFNVMEKGNDDEAGLARKEILRRISDSDVHVCLKVLQQSVQIQNRNQNWNELEGKALEVMTRSYSYFNKTLEQLDFTVKDLNFDAFKKICNSAKRAKASWDTSGFGGVTDSEDSNSEDEYGQLSCPSMQEDFKSILNWIQRDDIEERRKTLVLAVFKTAQRKSKASVLSWMATKIENWERKEKEEEEEMERIGAKIESDRALGIPFSCGIPGPYGARLDARWEALTGLLEDGYEGEVLNNNLKRLTKQFQEEDEDDLY